jgi:hypothetical protein
LPGFAAPVVCGDFLPDLTGPRARADDGVVPIEPGIEPDAGTCLRTGLAFEAGPGRRGVFRGRPLAPPERAPAGVGRPPTPTTATECRGVTIRPPATADSMRAGSAGGVARLIPGSRTPQVAQRLDAQPRESQHPEPNQEQHADRTSHEPQHATATAGIVDKDARRKIAHASPNPVTVGSKRSRQGRNTGIRARQPRLADRARADRQSSSQRHGSTPARTIALASSLPAASRARTTKYALA